MNASLVDELMGQLQGAGAGQMAQRLGADADTTRSAIAAALPMLVGALGRNAQQPDGAAALLGALQRDHGAMAQGAAAMPDLGGLLASMLGGAPGASAAPQMNAGGILGHVFGTAQPRAEAGLSQATGLDLGQAGNLLKMLAPMVMAALAGRVGAGGLDAGGLGSMLGAERSRMQQGGAGGGLLEAVLDQDGDGRLGLGDLIKLGGSLLGGRR